MFVPSITHPVGDFIREWVPKLTAYLPDALHNATLDSIAAFLINALLCIIAVCAVNIGSAPILIYMERKVCAHVQCRLGPMRLGWHGTIQTIADVIKMLFKEVYSPSGADKLMFYVAPLIVLIAPFIIAALIPFDHNLIVADIDMGIPMIIAVNGFGVLGILLGGWSSNNKYSLLGALRSGAQMISYEISFAMILLFVVMISGSTNLMDIAQAQDGTVPPLPTQTFLLRYLLESKKTPWQGTWKTFREMPWGEMYIKPYTGRVLTRAAFTFGTRVAAFRAACEKLGGLPLKNGDAGYEFTLVGDYRMRILVWEGDDEFQPNAQVLYSDNFADGFAAEDRVVAGDILIGVIKSRM